MYGSVSEADTYFSTYDFTGVWDSFSTSQKTAALNRATLMIDRLHFRGEKYQSDQDNAFPRIVYVNRRMVYFDENSDGEIVVPDRVKHAAYEQAKYMLSTQTDQSLIKLRQGITSISVGSTSESYNTDLLPEDLETGICRESQSLLENYLLVGW